MIKTSNSCADQPLSDDQIFSLIQPRRIRAYASTCIWSNFDQTWKIPHTNLYEAKFDQKFLCHGVGIPKKFPNRPERMGWCRDLLPFIRDGTWGGPIRMKNEWDETFFHPIRMGWEELPIRPYSHWGTPDPFRSVVMYNEK